MQFVHWTAKLRRLAGTSTPIVIAVWRRNQQSIGRRFSRLVFLFTPLNIVNASKSFFPPACEISQPQFVQILSNFTCSLLTSCDPIPYYLFIMAEVTMREWRVYLANDCFKQMMFVSGETGDPNTETTGMIEEIVRQQVVEIVGLNMIVFFQSNLHLAYPVQ